MRRPLITRYQPGDHLAVRIRARKGDQDEDQSAAELHNPAPMLV